MTKRAGTEMLDAGNLGHWTPDEARLEAIGHPLAQDHSVPLVRRAQLGDPTAFDALMQSRIDRAFRLAVAIVRSEADAADAVQDAFLSAWRHLPSLRDVSHFDAWLDRIVVNACRMTLRHRHGIRVREIAVDMGEHDGGNALALAADAEGDQAARNAELVRSALERLDADKRAILVLHHLDGRPIAEIASVLGIPRGTVKWRLHAARSALQGAVEEALR